MYYVLNQTNQIIAADKKLLKVCGVSDINALFSKMYSEDVIFAPQKDGKLLIANQEHVNIYSVKRTPLSCILGKIYIIKLKKSVVATLANGAFNKHKNKKDN